MAINQNSQETIYFVHMSDTHIGPTADYARHGYRSYPSLVRAIERIRAMPVRPDFVIHTGDVVTDPDPVSYRLAAELMAGLDLPVYYAVGNHDSAEGIRSYLPHGPYQPLLPDSDRHAYTFSVKGSEFMVLDGRAPDELDPQGLLGEQQLAEVAARTQTASDVPLTIFVHFPALPLNSPWFDRNMLLIEGERFHDMLCRSRRPLRGVFHGHIHMPLHTWRDGVLYCAAASTFANFAAWPDRPEADFVEDAPGYTFVQQLPQQTLIRHHVFDRPTESE